MRSSTIALLLALSVSTFGATVGLRNTGFEAGDLAGWDRVHPAHLFGVTDAAAHSGRFALRGRGDPTSKYNGFAHLVQPVPITPIPGTRCRITGWVRGHIKRGRRSARLSVRMVDADGKTIRYAETWLRPKPDRWQPVSQVFRVSEDAVKLQVYVILSALDADDEVLLDDIAFDKLYAHAAPVTVRPPEFSLARSALPVASTAEVTGIRLSGAGVEAVIDPATGLLGALTLTTPTALVLHPAAADTSRVFIQVGDREVLFDRPLQPPRQETGRVSAAIGPSGRRLPIRVEVTYTVDALGLHECVVFRATGDIDGLARVGVRHGFVPAPWERIIAALRPLRVLPATDDTLFTYGEAEHDLNLTRLDAWQSPVFPMAILEAKDRWLLVGDRSLDAFVTVTPNRPYGYFPSVQQNPTRIRAGDTFRFALSYRVFPKRTHLLRDVWRSYGEHVTSANPLLTGVVPFKPHFPPRTLPAGCEVTASGLWARRGARIDTSRTLPGSNIWYFGWHDWINERYPATGAWWARVGGWGKQNAEDFRSALSEYRVQGFHCYLYFRQIANLAQRGTVLPREWVRETPGGSLEMYGGGYTLELPKPVQREAGRERIPWGVYNFSNDAFRSGYLAQVHACMDYYQPAGIGWDMGWKPSNPGILTVQAQARQWLQQQHPHMRVIANEAFGTPSQWFADCVLIENGILYGKSEWDYEIAKAFGTQVASIERAHLYKRFVDTAAQGKPGWPSAGGREYAMRYVRWALAQPDAPADMKARSAWLWHRLHLRGGLYCLGLGANWAYADGMRAHRRGLAPALVTFMREIMNVPPVFTSFALRVNAGSDCDGPLHAGAWADPKRLRVAVFNDSGEARPLHLALSRPAFAQHGWERTDAPARAWLLDTAGAIRPAHASLAATREAMSLRALLPPFTLLFLSADDRD